MTRAFLIDCGVTHEIRLRDVEEADLPIFFQHQGDEVAVKMAVFASRDAASFYQHWTELLADEATLKKTILVDNVIAGNVVGFTWEGKREVGYWVGREYWGQGVATKALSDFLCVECTRPLHAGVAKHNAASLRVLEKCGFTPCSRDENSPAKTSDDSDHILLQLK